MLITPLLLLAGSVLGKENNLWPRPKKMWGWESEWAIVARNHLSDPRKMRVDVCNGWGNFCQADKCHETQKFDISGKEIKPNRKWAWWQDGVIWVQYDWAHIRRPDAAWIDLWRRVDGRFDVFQNQMPAIPYGFCEQVSKIQNGLPPKVRCPDEKGSRHPELEATITLACYQYN